MRDAGSDFIGRLSGFIETFGAFGLILMFFVTCIIVAIALWRGPGLMLFVLFLTYATGSISQSGIIFVSTLVRWLFLFLLGFMIFRKHFPMEFTLIFIVLYLLFGSLGNVRSPAFVWTIQQTVLLAMTILFIPIAVSGYISDLNKIAVIFKMGIVAVTVWVISNMVFLGEFRYVAKQRFTSSEEVGAGTVAYAGAFFAPMIVWGILQNRYKLWKLYSVLLIIPFLMILLVGAVRSVLFGLVLIASMPILISKFRLSKLIINFGVFSLLLIVSVYGLFIFFPEKATFLFERIWSTSTASRIYVWIWMFNQCLNDPIWGHGIGAGEIASLTGFGMYLHNAYLQVWYNSGILGLLSIMVFYVIYIFKSFRLIFLNPTAEIREYACICLGYILGILATGMFEGVFATAGGIGISMTMIIAIIIDRLGQIRNDLLTQDAGIMDESYSTAWSAENVQVS
jgi:O-antigen ligase